MNTPTLTAPEFKNGLHAAYRNGHEETRPQAKAQVPATLPIVEEDKPLSLSPVLFRHAAKKLMSNRSFQLGAGIVVLLLLGYFIYTATIHESTYDAYTTGHVHIISSRVTGTVIAVRVDDTLPKVACPNYLR